MGQHGEGFNILITKINVIALNIFNKNRYENHLRDPD